MRVRQEWALVSACSLRKGKKPHFLTSWGWVSCTCSHVSVRRQLVYILYTEEYILHVNGVCMTPYLSVLWWFSDFMCMKNEIQPLCSSPRHFSPTWHAQVCHNPLQKDVSTQVWQATANTNMMFDKQFYKQVLAKLQWTNSSNRFLLEIYKLLHASEVTLNPFYKYHRIYFVHKRILFTRLKHWQAHQC